MEEIVNRVANSQLITFDLEEYYTKGDRAEIDLKDALFQGLILKEKDFRDYIGTHDWSQYADKYIAITCSADAIVPAWAYMLLTTALLPYARHVVFGNLQELETQLFIQALGKIDWERFRGEKVVVKGCSKVDVPVAAYVELTRKLQPVAASIMFGEACSTVPLFKRKSH